MARTTAIDRLAPWGPSMFCETLPRPAGEIGIVEVVGGLAEHGHGRFAEGGQLGGRRSRVRLGGVGELLDEGGDGGLVGRGGRCACGGNRAGRGRRRRGWPISRVCSSAAESVGGAAGGGGWPAARPASSTSEQPTDITEDSVGTPGRARVLAIIDDSGATGGKKTGKSAPPLTAGLQTPKPGKPGYTDTSPVHGAFACNPAVDGRAALPAALPRPTAPENVRLERARPVVGGRCHDSETEETKMHHWRWAAGPLVLGLLVLTADAARADRVPSQKTVIPTNRGCTATSRCRTSPTATSALGVYQGVAPRVYSSPILDDPTAPRAGPCTT